MDNNEAISIIKGYIEYLTDMIDRNGYGRTGFDREQAEKDIKAFEMAITAMEGNL